MHFVAVMIPVGFTRARRYFEIWVISMRKALKSSAVRTLASIVAALGLELKLPWNCRVGLGIVRGITGLMQLEEPLHIIFTPDPQPILYNVKSRVDLVTFAYYQYSCLVVYTLEIKSFRMRWCNIVSNDRVSPRQKEVR